jgi:hypothetical protein
MLFILKLESLIDDYFYIDEIDELKGGTLGNVPHIPKNSSFASLAP